MKEQTYHPSQPAYKEGSFLPHLKDGGILSRFCEFVTKISPAFSPFFSLLVQIGDIFDISARHSKSIEKKISIVINQEIK